MVRGAGNVALANVVPKFYCERQSGGLCRMHALNAYFGHAKLDRAAFEAEIADYDIRQQQRGHAAPSAHDYDTTTGDQKNIIAHILAKSGIFTRIYESDPQSRSRAIAKAQEYGVAFVYTPDHIWLIRMGESPGIPLSAQQNLRAAVSPTQFTESLWFKIDSLSGIAPWNMNELTNPALGILVPTSRLMDEFNDIASELSALVMPDIIDYLIDSFRDKKIIGKAETLIGAACTLLELQNNGRTDYVKLNELFAWYSVFTREFRGTNCGSLKFILNTVPQIIARIISIWRCSRKCAFRESPSSEL